MAKLMDNQMKLLQKLEKTKREIEKRDREMKSQKSKEIEPNRAQQKSRP